jgi:hypothetical protein
VDKETRASGETPNLAALPLYARIFGKPEGIVWSGRNAQKHAVGCGQGELAERARRGDTSNLAGDCAVLVYRKPEGTVWSGRDAVSIATRCGQGELAERAQPG